MSIAAGGYPVKSMTGFARVCSSCAGVDLIAEVRSVNQRYLEVAVKGPRFLSAVERDFKAIFQRMHRRGRIDLTITRRAAGVGKAESFISSGALDEFVTAYSAACKRYGVYGDGLAQFVGSLVLRESGAVDEVEALSDEEARCLLSLVEQASEALVHTREAEGSALVRDLQPRLAHLGQIHGEVQALMSGASQRIRERLLSRLSVISSELPVDPDRLALEVALLADRVDVSEELSRLAIHLQRFQETLRGEPDGVGRKLDFLTQEIGRELNTITSKAQDASVQGLVVDGKVELERIREQVQNIE